MAIKGRNLLAPLSDAEALAVMKVGISVYNSPDSPIKEVPEQFEQPSELQTTFDGFKESCDAAHPNESRQEVNQRVAKRKVFDEKMGNFIDTVVLASRKAPHLPAVYGLDGLLQNKGKLSKTSRVLIPYLILQALDKEVGIVHCKVRGGVRQGIEIQHAYEDPSNEANWMYNDAYVNANFVVSGLSSGRRTYMRGRYIFSKGKKSPWSEIVNIMVP